MTGALGSTGDDLIFYGRMLEWLTRAIDSGARIAIMHGDRDYMCNYKLVDSCRKIIYFIPM